MADGSLAETLQQSIDLQWVMSQVQRALKEQGMVVSMATVGVSGGRLTVYERGTGQEYLLTAVPVRKPEISLVPTGHVPRAA